jgi:DNA-binding phage protein
MDMKRSIISVSKRYQHWLKQQALSKSSIENPIKARLAWRFAEAMKSKKLSKTAMAAAMKTSRAQLDRVLDPKNGNVTFATLERAAKAVGRKLRMELV